MMSTKKKVVEKIYPLSPMQQGMLFHALYEPHSNLYVGQRRQIIRGRLDCALLKRCWQRVIERHTILRTQFMWEGLVKPLQVVWDHIQLPWSEYDWREFPAQERVERLEDFLREDSLQGFKMDQAPLFRLSLIREEQECYQFIWTVHHALIDGWSLASLFLEVFELYEAGLDERRLTLSNPRPYSDYISWLQQQNQAKAEAFWREMLAGFTSPTAVQVVGNGEAQESKETQFREQIRVVSPELLEGLKRLAQRYKLTLNTLMQGTWAILLGHYSGERDVVFGSVVSGRPAELSRSESMIGLFINTLPMRVQLDPHAKLMNWFQQFQLRYGEMRQYEYCSLLDIQSWSDILSGTPLFENIVVVEGFPHDTAGLDQRMSVQVDMVHVPERTNYPLNFAAVLEREVTLCLTYDCRRVEEAAAHSMIEHFLFLLERIVAQPLQRLLDLSHLRPALEHLVVHNWNATAITYPEILSVADLLERQAARTPDVVALCFDEQQITFKELNQRANRLAHRLQRCGVGPEVIVGLCFERSLEMIVATLAILKAGGCYLPLDPTYPQERLAFIYADVQLSFLLTQRKLLAHLPATPAHIFFPGEEEYSDECAENPRRELLPENAVYIIYTSGSTGAPKGVLIPHEAFYNLFENTQQVIEMGVGSRMLQLASLSFDASAAEIWIMLAQGATLCLGSRETLMPGTPLAEVLERQAITCLAITPSALMTLPTGEFPRLQHIITSGEPCTVEALERWGEGHRFYNAYGPTETTVYSTIAVEQHDPTRLHIGRPINNTQIYILNDLLQPVPVGVSGKIYIGGLGLARGYFKRPDLTAARFVPHAFSREPGERLYDTGDLGRYTEDGRVLFLGRDDDQVKIRGFRVELGEIERALNQHSFIQQSVVIVDEDLSGNRRLVAYIQALEGEHLNKQEVRDFLQTKLPPFAVPNSYIVLENLPLTPNGKIDRRNLPAPNTARNDDESYQAPRDIFEMQLARIYEDILQIHPIGLQDNFFMLGGHSLLALHLVDEIQKRMGLRVTLPTLFQDGSVAQLAYHLRQQQERPHGQSVYSPLITIKASGKRRPFFGVHPANGNVACYYGLVRHLSPDQPFYGIQDTNIYSEMDAFTTLPLTELAAEYIKAIRSIQQEGPYYLGGYSFGGIVAFEMAQQLLRSGQEVALLAIIDGSSPAPTEHDILDETRLLAVIASEWLREYTGKGLQEIYEELLPLSQDEQLAHVLHLTSKAQINLLSGSPEWLRRQVQIFKSRMLSAEGYQASVYPGKMTLFRSGESDEHNMDDDMGWRQFSALPLDIRVIPGYHNTMMKDPYVQHLAEQLQASLEQAQAALK